MKGEQQVLPGKQIRGKPPPRTEQAIYAGSAAEQIPPTSRKSLEKFAAVLGLGVRDGAWRREEHSWKKKYRTRRTKT
jgi:hypothetical protein